ncbi:hypothetical protein [Mesorhizobium sp. W016]
MRSDKRPLVILLGVSECPKAPKFTSLPQCASSADEFFRYCYVDLEIPRANILDLFDSTQNATEQISTISSWLKKKLPSDVRNKADDLIIFYSGHGAFGHQRDKPYFLVIRETTEDDDSATSLRFGDLAAVLINRAREIRRTVILDCCFAGTAVAELMTPLSELVREKVDEKLPIQQSPGSGGAETGEDKDLAEKGTALFCSSAARLASIAPAGRPLTMFCEALFSCLKHGKENGKEWLTLEDLEQPVQQYIADTFPDDGVRPELWKPYQIRGNPAKAPLFRNSLWRAIVASPPAGQTPHENVERALGDNSASESSTEFKRCG